MRKRILLAFGLRGRYRGRMSQASKDELLERVKSTVRKKPADIPTVLDAVASTGATKRQAREAVQRLVERGELELNVAMELTIRG